MFQMTVLEGQIHIINDMATLPEEERKAIRAFVFLRNEKLHGTREGPQGILNLRSDDNQERMTVTNLLDRTWYLVEQTEPGYLLSFPLKEGRVMIELELETDVSTIADDLSDLFADSGAQFAWTCCTVLQKRRPISESWSAPVS